MRPSTFSPIAQSVERRTVNPQVAGSSPARGARFQKARFMRTGLFAACPDAGARCPCQAALAVRARQRANTSTLPSMTSARPASACGVQR
ncbi:Uncharacterised protein [Bordetella pertussis]|nr:Uncharacterised protein [Bordetella pertussis]